VTNIPDTVKEEPVKGVPGANRMPISHIRIDGGTQLRAACSESLFESIYHGFTPV